MITFAPRTIILLMVLAVTYLSTGLRADDPKGQKTEAETGVASDSQVIDDPGASAGKAVSNGHAWQPISEVAVPTDGGDVFTVSARQVRLAGLGQE